MNHEQDSGYFRSDYRLNSHDVFLGIAGDLFPGEELPMLDCVRLRM